MDSNSFKRNVLRTVSPRLAKAGLRDSASTNQNANLIHGIVGLNTEVGGLLENLNPYLLGFQLNNELLQATFTSLGGVSYYVVLLAKTLNVKIPGSGKKVHLHALTKTEAILRLNTLSNDLLYEAMATFRDQEINLEATADLVRQILDTLWPATYDLLGITPAQVFASYNDRLAAGFPEGLFSQDKDAVNAALVALYAQETEVILARKEQKAKAKEDKKLAREAAKAANAESVTE